MNNVIIAILLIIIILSGCSCFYRKLTDRVEPVASEVNGKHYSVRSDTINKKESADYLATISEKVDTLVLYMVNNGLPNYETATRLKNRWENCELRETASHESAAAYTINKGDEMRLCVRTKGVGANNILEDMNTSMFVVLHELGHLMSISYGHNEEFRDNFSYIVHLASSIGIYKPEDFDNKPVEYCGTEINTSPCISGVCGANF